VGGPNAAGRPGQVAGAAARSRPCEQAAGATVAKGLCTYLIPIHLPLKDNQGRPHGAVVGIETVARLAGLWFGDYASPDSRRKTAREAEAIFRALELDGAFWALPAAFR
jgi:hypothetical protein